MFFQALQPHLGAFNRKTLKRGDILYHEGDAPQNLYLIEDGLLGLFHIAESGKETFLRVFGQHSILGHRSYFADEPYHATSIALAKTTLVVISNKECDRICREQPELMKLLIGQLSRDLKQAELRLAGLQDKSANVRISESLVFLKLKYPQQVWTRKEIGEYSCSSLETVARVMTRLEEMGLIKKVGRDFKILEQDRLLNLTFSDF